MTTVYCSGLLGPPSPGAGASIARSLREAFPDLELVGVGESPRSTGLHDPVFDDVWIHGADASPGAIAERLDAGGWWICGDEREVRLPAAAIGGHDRLLSPGPFALRRIDAPAGDLARRLGLLTAPAISTREDDWLLTAFGREHGWRLELAGPGREAARIDSWRALEGARARLADGWSAPGLQLRARIEGAREAIAFAAHRGAALGCAHLRTAIDGTAGGRVTVLDGALASLLDAELLEARWTGGGELELVRTADGALWLSACRPRFATWVHGATLAGTNLPAALLGAALGRTAPATEARGSEFVRVVVEVPVRAGCALPEPVVAAGDVVRAGNYLTGMPDPASRASGGQRPHPREDAVEPAGSLRAAVGRVRPADATPCAHAVDPVPRWERLAASIRDAAGGRRVEIAYSIKTDPDPALLSAAHARGFLAEGITAAEMRAALAAGFQGEQIVLNGPAKLWPPAPGAAPLRAYAVFADSLGELSSLAAMARDGDLSARYLGPRLRPPAIASRFGVRLDDFDTFGELVAALRDLPAGQSVGLHFHWASSEAGHDTWFETVESTLEWGRCLQELSGRAVACLDLGGGWQPDDFEAAFLPRLPALVARCHAELDALEVIVLEPGRALVQPLSFVETTVLAVRDSGAAREIVVDASLAEVPRANTYPHRILGRAGERWLHWGRGPDRVLGRLCMEDDVLRTGIAVPDDVRPGSRVLIADAGAYDRSMAYRFGCG